MRPPADTQTTARPNNLKYWNAYLRLQDGDSNKEVNGMLYMQKQCQGNATVPDCLECRLCVVALANLDGTGSALLNVSGLETDSGDFWVKMFNNKTDKMDKVIGWDNSTSTHGGSEAKMVVHGGKNAGFEGCTAWGAIDVGSQTVAIDAHIEVAATVDGTPTTARVSSANQQFTLGACGAPAQTDCSSFAFAAGDATIVSCGNNTHVDVEVKIDFTEAYNIRAPEHCTLTVDGLDSYGAA